MKKKSKHQTAIFYFHLYFSKYRTATNRENKAFDESDTVQSIHAPAHVKTASVLWRACQHADNVGG